MRREEQGSETEIRNSGCAAADDLRAYYARKRTVGVRTLLLVLSLAALVAVRSIGLGIILAVGGGCGVAYMLMTMRAGERFLGGAESVAAYRVGSVVRIVLFGAIPVVMALHAPWWTMGVYFAGFFTPHVLYAIVVVRESHRGTTCTSKSANI